jgi:transcriptional regulator with XRE-family HTH domain
MKKYIYNRLKIILAEKGMQNKELAESLKIAPQTVSRWCTNSMQPSVEMLFKMAKTLDVDVREFLVTTKKA